MKYIVLIICIFIITTMTGCTNSKVINEDTVPSDFITNVFTSVEFEFPEDYTYVTDFSTNYDSINQTITLCAIKYDYHINADGIYTYHFYNSLITYDKNGKEIDWFELPLAENAQIIGGELTEDFIYCISIVRDDTSNVFLNKIDRNQKKVIGQVEMVQIDGIRQNMSPQYFCVDNDENMYLAFDHKIVILDEKFSWLHTVKVPNTLFSLVRLSDGFVYGCSVFQGERGIAKIDKSSGMFESSIFLDKTLKSVSGGDGYDFFYNTSEGVYGAKFIPEVGIESEYIIDNINSGIITSDSGYKNFEGSAQFITMIDEKSAIYAESRKTENGFRLIPVLYTKAPDLELSDVVTIEIAYAHTMEDAFREQIIRFNKNHSKVRVKLLDYTDNDDEDAGVWRLLTDIQNNLIKPDIIYDSIDGAFGVTENSVLGQMANQGMFVDLKQYLREDDYINDNNIFGAVKRAFSNENGEMWGITPFFYLYTYFTTPEILGEYSAQTNWSLEEFLNFTKNIPSGHYLIQECTQETLGARVYQDYTDFIDFENATCSFDSELFKRYLNYILSLPTEDNYKKIPEIGDADYDKLVELYRNKTFMMGRMSISSSDILYHINMFLDSDKLCLIGNPNSTNYGAKFYTKFGFMITSFADKPDLCWELMKYFFDVPADSSYWSSSIGMSALKSKFDEDIDKLRNNTVIAQYADYTFGSYSGVSSSEEIPEEVHERFERRNIPYEIISIDDERVQYFRNYLDNDGQSLLSQTPLAITNIIEEEISVLVGGVGSAEDCARKIQSRVMIWLSEHQ